MSEQTDPKRRRRVAGEGGLFQRADGKWIAQLSTGPRGNRSTIQRVRPTRAAAAEALRELRDDQRAGVRPSSLSVGAYLRQWLDNSARPSISVNTYRGYDDAIALWAPIAHIPLAKLTPEDVERVANAMLAQKGSHAAPRYVPASDKTIRNAEIMLRRALQQAVDRGHVRRNVARLVPLRRVARRSREAMTPDRARAVLAAIAGDRYEAAYSLAMIGLRASEVLGLAWADVDLVGRVVRVRYQLVGSGPNAARAELKTSTSEAAVPLPSFVVERLLEHEARQRAERPVVDVAGGLVFVTSDGYAVNVSWFGKHFQALLEAAGVPKLTVHELRHGAASLLAGRRVHPRVAQELLRHASFATTMSIYTHTTSDQIREAADELDAAIAGKRRRR